MAALYELTIVRGYRCCIKATWAITCFPHSVQKYVTNDLGVVNSYDTWHGKCNMFLHESI